jgi:hypothetical protein
MVKNKMQCSEQEKDSFEKPCAQIKIHNIGCICHTGIETGTKIASKSIDKTDPPKERIK